MNWYFRRPYKSVAKRKERAEKKLKQLLKKNPDMAPVTIEGRSLAKTWWGKAWNSNLENYADFSYRMERGRSYVRHSSVLDLQISQGKIEALVHGSPAKPYKINIKIKPVEQKTLNSIKDTVKDKIESVQELLEGKFPQSLSEIFTAKDRGLFPAPFEIQFDCTCPDWASMCKHVAAALYGVGARLDTNPELFFTLRAVNMNDLVQFAVNNQKDDLLKSASKDSSRKVIKDEKLSAIFGIDFDDEPVTTKMTSRKINKKVNKKNISKKKATKKTTKKKITKKKVVKSC